mmetsp:Transcript_8370/g.12102  ORF Transcript_8370/g.12102 Transcript_8370/m.12102 type:complete len:91 (+) Transcript_8370:2473-2745(+)
MELRINSWSTMKRLASRVEPCLVEVQISDSPFPLGSISRSYFSETKRQATRALCFSENALNLFLYEVVRAALTCFLLSVSQARRASIHVS